MKPRKPRTTGSSLRFELGHQFGREDIGIFTPANDKLTKRLLEGLCLGCGKKICKCKSKGNINVSERFNRIFKKFRSRI